MTAAIPPITPDVVMRVGTVPIVSYTRPGSAEAKPIIAAIVGDDSAGFSMPVRYLSRDAINDLNNTFPLR